MRNAWALTFFFLSHFFKNMEDERDARREEEGKGRKGKEKGGRESRIVRI